MQQARDRLVDAEAILRTAHPAGDYEAAPASAEEAAEFVKGTAEFIGAIERLMS